MADRRNLSDGTRGVNTIVAILAIIAFIVLLAVIVFEIQYFLAIVIILVGTAMLVLVKTPWVRVIGAVVLILGIIDAILVSTAGSLALAIDRPGVVLLGSVLPLLVR